jgi:hypothetical protein
VRRAAGQQESSRTAAAAGKAAVRGSGAGLVLVGLAGGVRGIEGIVWGL